MRKRSVKSVIFWFWGPTASGKSRLVSEAAPDAYWKLSGGIKWW
jgi:adenylylsulfate kinase-like enzyme